MNQNFGLKSLFFLPNKLFCQQEVCQQKFFHAPRFLPELRQISIKNNKPKLVQVNSMKMKGTKSATKWNRICEIGLYKVRRLVLLYMSVQPIFLKNETCTIESQFAGQFGQQ